MVWKLIYRFLLNDKVIDRLADSYPIRRAAQWVVYFFNKTKAINPQENLFNPKNQETFKNLSEKLEQKLKKVKEDLEKQSKKY